MFKLYRCSPVGIQYSLIGDLEGHPESQISEDLAQDVLDLLGQATQAPSPVLLQETNSGSCALVRVQQDVEYQYLAEMEVVVVLLVLHPPCPPAY